ncbi:thioredoxin [Verruconis gallopava]|uniref:Thioredoxin n=1 Tax=Verruconis gallopava TaxID=253628 RepID=A0A0D2B3X6_9PEZI|nr:thioredoxin [Verruconis gallopava]KIW05929.1 thioredoxin [Verruconis gallopava]
MSKINHVSSSAQFSKVLSSNTCVVVDFFAEWCGPCKAIAPIFEQLATSHAQPGKVAFVKVDVDQSQDIAERYGVSAMPTFLVFKNGSVFETVRGANPSALRAAVAKASAEAAKGPAKSSSFSSKGYTLGGGSTPSRPVGNGAALGQSFADQIVRFIGLYLTTLFSFDAYAAAEASPLSVRAGSRR